MKTAKRRRREHKTDYAKRIKLLKAGVPRIVFRKTNRYFIAQYVTSKRAQDKIEIGINSKKLVDYGWPKELTGSLKSIPSAYLTGLLIGKKILKIRKSKGGEKTPIIDFGMIRNLHKTKIYGFLKGLIDAGLDIKFDKNKEIFPNEERIKGKHTKKKIDRIFDQIKNKIESEGGNLK